jgi:RNA polymerase sigma-70 factor (ECF subfamily)
MELSKGKPISHNGSSCRLALEGTSDTIYRETPVTDSVFSSFDALARHRPYLCRYAFSRLRDRGAAEDVVQETLMAAVEGQAKFRGESALLTWLTGILKHKIVAWQRREARNPSRVTTPSRIDLDGELEQTADALFDSAGRWVNPPSAWPNPEQSFENQQFWKMFESCLADLSPASARAFYLREIQGMEGKEICAELDISESNCWVMLHRARMSLRQKIEERWFNKATMPRADAKPKRVSPSNGKGTNPSVTPGQLACSMV